MDDERRNALTVDEWPDCWIAPRRSSSMIPASDSAHHLQKDDGHCLYIENSAMRRDGQGWSESGYDVSHIMDGLYGESLRIKYVAIENGLRSINVSLSIRQSDISDKPEAIPHVTHSEKEDT